MKKIDVRAVYALIAAALGCLCCCPHAQADEIRVQADGNRRVSVTIGAQKQVGLFGRWAQARDERKSAEAKSKEPKIILVPEGSTLLGSAAQPVPMPMPPRPRVVIE